jgi:hypothetical protein
MSVALAISASLSSETASQTDGSRPWIAAVRIIRNGEQSGSGVYMKSGLVLTAAHLTATDAEMSVHIAGARLPARILKQGVFEDVDVSLLAVDDDRLPAAPVLPEMRLCNAPPWPGDPVIVVDAQGAARSRIVSPQVLAFQFRHKFSTLIGDVATTGNSGSGVFDPDRKCLLGIMSRKFMAQTPQGQKDIAKYFVPASIIREFIPAEFALVLR